MNILIVVSSFREVDQAYIINGFLNKGVKVDLVGVNSLTTREYKVFGDVLEITDKMDQPYGNPKGEVAHKSLETYDLIWVMNQPHHNIAQDVWQILWMLSKRVPFVNSVEGMLFLNNKNNLGAIVPKEHLIENYAANSYDQLWSIYEKKSKEKWVLKPTNAGCGEDVYTLFPNESNVKTIMQSMTGNAMSQSIITKDVGLIGLQNKYCLIQKYIPEVKELGDKRVILAGGKVICQYRRIMPENDHRSHDFHGGSIAEYTLTSEEQSFCEMLAKRLLDNGISFVGIDMSYPYLLEFNIVNPGGVESVESVTGIDHTDEVIEAILNACLNKSNSIL
ncbi:ATP-grasp domain-containing protein [Chengkuizengella axinellae]|uniref:ATP-grasp domain-containing protein n=1 Tax=Chengkuizengella axinellae TaxID=3064388 RepID=A0ABT9IZW8_9BACL|nr:hypothetical protein [Chengkuizengella sp. 2205SS18-9]MDP5274863.1 hypothetical protein [Chengkuizengella sp. 2205SS18-9]